jgi:GT2 family glycosyltransferase
VRDLSILVVNYNGGPLLVDVLRAAYASADGLDYEVLLWDNASGDGSIDRVERDAPHERLVVHRHPENVGFVRATNRQLAQAQGRVILLLNSDAVPEGAAIATLHRYVMAHDDVGAVGPRLRLPDGRLDAACRRRAKRFSTYVYRAVGLDRRFPSSSRFGHYNATDLPEDREADIDALSGACLMARRRALESVGFLMDERFRMYCEDEDWCLRLRKGGWRVVYQPSAVVWHMKGHSSGSTRRVAVRTAYEWHRSVALFHRKHLAPSLSWPANGATYLMVGASLAATVARRLLRPPQRRPVPSERG